MDAANRPTTPQANLLRITGSSTMCPLITAISERYRAVQPAVRIEVQCGGGERGIKDVREGNAEIGMMARALKKEEKDLVGYPIARDGLSIIVHAANPLTSLSEEQVADIFSGKIGSWQPLTGKAAPIVVLIREETQTARELFERHFDLKERVRGKVVFGDNPVIIAAVASNPDAIGYVSSGEGRRQAQAGATLRIVSLGGIMPTERNIITGNYPLTRPLSLITRGLPSGPTKHFIDYCLSSKVVDLIRKYDFVPYED